MNESNLRAYQRAAVEHAYTNTHAGLLLGMGLGKTVSTLTLVNRLIYQELAISKVLVVAPKKVASSVWDAEVEKWGHLRHLRVSKVIGPAKKRRQALEAQADVYVIGRDNIVWLCGQYGGSMLPFDMLVIDELSSFKNPQSQRFKALKMVQPSFERVIGLTGTPAPNGLIDLWSQIFLLDRGERLGKTIGSYRTNFFKPDKRNGHIVYSYRLLERSEQQIFERISDICISMKSEDYLELPPVIENVIKVPLSDKERQEYADFERDQVMKLLAAGDEVEISVANAAGLSNKLLQFANGAVYDEDKNYHAVHEAKLEALDEIMEAANGSPVLVAWAFRHDLYRILDKFKKYEPRELKTDQDISDWNDGKIRMCLMHPASGGHGLNLQFGGNITVWFGQTWSLELFQQLNARLNRPGQKNQVIIHRLVTEGTIEEDVVASVANKDTTQETLLQAVKAKIAKYIVN